MLGIHPGCRDYHHAYVRDHCTDEGRLYLNFQDALADNPGTNCYVLASSTDPVWYVVSGKSPTNFRADELDDWFPDITVRGRIDRDSMA